METPLNSDPNHTVTRGDKTRDQNVTSHGVCSHQQWKGKWGFCPDSRRGSSTWLMPCLGFHIAELEETRFLRFEIPMCVWWCHKDMHAHPGPRGWEQKVCAHSNVRMVGTRVSQGSSVPGLAVHTHDLSNWRLRQQELKLEKRFSHSERPSPEMNKENPGQSQR